MTTNNKKRKILLGAAAVALVLGSLLINIKNVLTSCHVDAEYQVVMGYRMLQGDAMFSEMWEAHQTSAFFLAFFEWLFLKVTGSTTGIMLYANAVGFLCKTAVAFTVFATLRKYVDKKAAFASLLFLLNTYPKEIQLPDFANLQIWFALLLMCCMITYFEGAGKLRWLILGGVFLCLEVLSYPSCVVVWVPCVVLIARYSNQRKRDFFVFTGVCGVGGIAYLLYFMRGNPRQFMEYIYYIWSGDEAHAVGIGERLSLIGKDIASISGDLKYIGLSVILAAATIICRQIINRSRGKKAAENGWRIFFSWFTGFYVLGYLILLPRETAGVKLHFFLLYIFVEIAAFFCVRYLNETEKRIFFTGQLIGFGGFLATLILSDMGFIPTLCYMIPNICVCIPALAKNCGEQTDSGTQAGQHGIPEKGKTAALLNFVPILVLCAVMIFRNAVYVNGWMYAPSNFYEDSIFGVDWTAKYGPLKGIVNRGGTYVADVTYLEFQELLNPGDKVLILSYPTIAATVYLNSDMIICADSTISTPTYSPRLFEYWEDNPEKYPDVVIVKCFEGSVTIGDNKPILDWFEQEVIENSRVVDGTYWRYYFLE